MRATCTSAGYISTRITILGDFGITACCRIKLQKYAMSLKALSQTLLLKSVNETGERNGLKLKTQSQERITFLATRNNQQGQVKCERTNKFLIKNLIFALLHPIHPPLLVFILATYCIRVAKERDFSQMLSSLKKYDGEKYLSSFHEPATPPPFSLSKYATDSRDFRRDLRVEHAPTGVELMITSCNRVYSIEEYGNLARFKASSALLPTRFRNDDGTITSRFDEGRVQL